MHIELNDKVIVVTGSSKGIGKEILKKLAGEGASVVINYKSDSKKAKKLLEDIRKFNEKCIVVQADVSIESDVKVLYKRTVESFGKVDILINNAGMCDDNHAYFMNYNQWSKVLKTNLDSAFLCSRYFSKQMIKNNGGKILNISSIKGQLGSEGQCNYAASKAGMIGLTKSLAKELGRFNVSINAICPGFVITDLNRNNKNKADIANKMSLLGNENTIEDLVNFIILMASDNIKGISGQVFNLDSRIL